MPPAKDLSPSIVDLAPVPPSSAVTGETLRLWQAFAPLAPELRRRALARGVVETVRAGQLLLDAGGVTVVVSGCLITFVTDTGVAAELLGPGGWVVSGGKLPVRGRWITDGEIYRVALEDWRARSGPDGILYMVEAADHRRVALEHRLICSLRHLSTARVADLLLTVHKAAPGLRIRMSQGQLGAWLSLRRTTVNASCRALEQRGGLRTRRGEVRVVDPARLAETACGCHNFARSEEAPVGPEVGLA